MCSTAPRNCRQGTGPHFSICTALATQRCEKKCKNCWPVTSKLLITRTPILGGLHEYQLVNVAARRLPDSKRIASIFFAGYRRRGSVIGAS